MKTSDLISYIYNKNLLLISHEFMNRIHASIQYKEFIIHYKDKIRKKISGAITDEDREDIICELKIPYLLLSDKKERFSVQYEKYGKVDFGSPDFTCIFNDDIEFNIEVKRMRFTKEEEIYYRIKNEIIERIRNIPSGIGFNVNIDTPNSMQEFLKELDRHKENIINFIERTILDDKDKLFVDTPCLYAIPNLNVKAVLQLSKPGGENINKTRTINFWDNDPILFKQKDHHEFKDHHKFGDEICCGLKQMISGMINVLVLDSYSPTHDRIDLQWGIDSLFELIREENESFFNKKGFKGICDFREKLRLLSGIVYLDDNQRENNLSNKVWINRNAECQIPHETQEYLEKM